MKSNNGYVLIMVVLSMTVISIILFSIVSLIISYNNVLLVQLKQLKELLGSGFTIKG